MIDFLIFHSPANPNRRFVFPQERRLARVDGFDLSLRGRCDQRRSVTDQHFFIERTAPLIILHVPNQKYGAFWVNDFFYRIWYLSFFEFELCLFFLFY